VGGCGLVVIRREKVSFVIGEGGGGKGGDSIILIGG